MTVGQDATPDALAERAKLLAGFGGAIDDGLMARFTAVADALTSRRHLAGDLRTDTHDGLVDVLRKRLELARFRHAVPAISAEVVQRPVFIVGFPRTGTTLLHSLLMAGPGCRAPRLWEVRNPSPPPALAPRVDPRLALGNEDARAWCAAVPGMLQAHPYFDQGAQAPVEDEEMMALDFQSMYPTWYMHARVSVLHGVASGDTTQGFAFHRELLQHLQWGHTPARWVCKGTAHQFVLDALWSIYPDALCIWAHRRPSETYGSTLALTRLISDAMDGSTDGPALAEGLLSSTRVGMTYALSGTAVDDPRLLHVRYTDLVDDPHGTLEQVCQHIDEPFDDGCSDRIKSWLADPANASNRHGRFTYDLADFGVSPDDVDAQFADYTARFLA